jgi:hypothetical protein
VTIWVWVILQTGQENGVRKKLTLGGKPAAFVQSTADDKRRTERTPSLVAFLRRSPLAELDLDIDRDKTPPREIDL